MERFILAIKFRLLQQWNPNKIWMQMSIYLGVNKKQSDLLFIFMNFRNFGALRLFELFYSTRSSC